MYGKATLSELMSKICGEVYSHTPIINNEVINKNEITNMAANSRNKIIAALLRQELEPNLGLRGTGQDVSIMRSTLIRTGVFVDGDNPQINFRPQSFEMKYLLETIKNFILETKKNPTRFSVLYERLTLPNGQIGLRRGVIPIYLAAVIHAYRQQITISNNFEPMKTNVDTLIQINSAPENFSIEYLDWNADNENFIASLAEVFKDFIVGAEKNFDSCDYVANAITRWFLSLPKYAKEFKTRPDGGKIADTHIKLRNILRQNLSGSDLLFKKLPKIFSEDLTTTTNQIISAKKFFDNAVNELKNFILSETKIIFSATNNLMSTLRDWCTTLDQKIFEQLFPDETDKFLRLIKSEVNEKIFVEESAKLATGFKIEDWNESAAENYFDKLKQFKMTAENFHCDETSERQFVFVEGTEKIVKRFELVELSPRGEILFNQITTAIDSMGQSISVQEKRQILMEILNKL